MRRDDHRLATAARHAVVSAIAIIAAASAAGAQTTYRLTLETLTGRFFGTAQVTSSPAAIDCRVAFKFGNSGTCAANFPAGSVVTLSATALNEGTFDGWTGACSGTGACQVVMDQDRRVGVNVVAKTYTLTVLGTGNAHGKVIDPHLLAIGPYIGCFIAPGGVTSGQCVAEYTSGSTAELSWQAPADTRASFAGFSGDCTDSYCRVVMNGDKTVTAGWIAWGVTISSAGGNGTGKVTGAAPNHPSAAFDCAVTAAGASGVCSVVYERHTPPSSITLTATPMANSVFAGWSGACSGAGECVLARTFNPHTVSALFVVPTFSLTVASAGTGSGTVTSVPAGITCTISGGGAGQNCAAPFANGTSVTLTADPTGGGTFGGWTGACTGTQLTCTVTVSAAAQATARFDAPRPAAQLALALLGGLTLSPAEQIQLDRFGNKDGTFNLGDLLALMARTGEKLPGAMMNAVLHAQGMSTDARTGGRSP